MLCKKEGSRNEFIKQQYKFFRKNPGTYGSFTAAEPEHAEYIEEKECWYIPAGNRTINGLLTDWGWR